MKWLNCLEIRMFVVVFVTAIVFGSGRVRADFTFTEPVNLGPTVNSSRIDCGPSLSADGLRLYFASYMSKPEGWDIFMATRETPDSDWSDCVRLGPGVNSPNLNQFDPSISSDGLELYFSQGTLNQGITDDLYVATRQTTDDEWGIAVSLGDTINSSLVVDQSPCISADGLSLYFGSSRPGGDGGSYVTTRLTKNDDWSTPVNIGPPVSGGGVSISTDGLSLVFHDDSELWVTTRRTTSDPWREPINLGPEINTEDLYSGVLCPDGTTFLLVYWDRSGGYGNLDIWQQAVVPIVDFNGDEVCDIDDLVIMIENWGTSETLCDIGPMPWGDGVVDMKDLEVWIKYWEQENMPEDTETAQ